MSKEQIADSNGVKPGAEGYIETFAPDKPEVVKPEADTKVDKTKPDPVPYKRFEEINTRMKTAETALDKLKGETADIAVKEKEKQGEFEELYTTEKKEHAETKKKADKWTEYEKERRKALLGKIPEKHRELYEELSLIKLEKVVENYSKDGVPGVTNESPSRESTAMTDEEKKKHYKKTPKDKRDSHKTLVDSYQNK